MIKYTIQEIIGWAPSFSLLEIVTQKDYLSCFICVLKVSLRLTLIQKGGLCPLKLLPLMTEFSVFMPLQIYSTKEQLARGSFFEKLQNYTESRNDGNENKILIGKFSCTIDKTVGDGEIKRLAVPIMPCQNSSWITGPEDLWIREYPDSLEFSCQDKSFGNNSGQTGSILI